MSKNFIDLRLSDYLVSILNKDKNINFSSQAIDNENLIIYNSLINLDILNKINILPEKFLDLLAWQFHVDDYEPLHLPINQKRNIIKNAILVHRYKGSVYAVKTALESLDFFAEIDENTGTPFCFDINIKCFSLDREVEDILKQVKSVINNAKPITRQINNISLEILDNAFSRTDFYSEICCNNFINLNIPTIDNLN